MADLTFGSLFAGVGGFDLGFEAAGWTPRWQVEWDARCQSVLARHWPQVARYGDVCDASHLPPVDCITYGFPCQDLSVAGRRAGLDGDRSNLFFEAVRIIKEMRDETGGQYPTFAVAENVPGLLSADGGAAMGRCLDALADIGAVGIEWAVLDAQHFGVPQRRRRVFIVAWWDPRIGGGGPLLPVGESCSRDFAASKQAGQAVAALTGTGVGTCGADDNQGQAGHLIPAITDPSRLDEVAQTLFGSDPVLYEPRSLRDENWAESEVKAPLRAEASAVSHVLVSDPTLFKKQRSVGRPGAPTLNAFDNGTESRATVLAATRSYKSTQVDGSPIAATLRGFGHGWQGQHNSTNSVATADGVRRLTPRECERLMGWPDDHTRWADDGTQIADTNRYKMCGNGVVASVSKWVADRLSDAVRAAG